MRFLCFGITALLLWAAPVFAQGVPRIKVRVLSFDGKTLTVQPDSGEPMTVGVLPTTRYARQEKRVAGDIKQGDYLGATINKGSDSVLHVQEIHIFPDSLRGSGEGIFPLPGQPGRSMINATAYSTTSNTAGLLMLGLKYRGAEGGDGPTCTGRAPRNGGCNGSTGVLVASGIPVTALVDGDKKMLVPGAVLALSVMAGPDGKPVTPGLTVESLPSDEPSAADKLVHSSSTPPAPKGAPGHPTAGYPTIGN